MLKKYALVIVIGYTIAITILSFISLDGAPSLGIDYEDKLIHAGVYFGFALLWYYYFNSIHLKLPLAYAVVLALVYGIVIELLQGCLSSIRQFDYYDILANIVGTLFVIPVIKFLRRDVKKY